MQIRFLQTTQSDRPEFPFQAGQVINLPSLTTEARGWLMTGMAVLVKAPVETAVEESREHAVVGGPKKGRR